MSTLTPQMSLYLSTVGVDSGLTWELNLNADMSIIDGHNHSPGSGAPILSSSINISGDLSFNNFNATDLRSVRFNPQSSPLSGPSDLDCLYVSGVDLYYNDGNGNQIQITQSGSIPVAASEIVNGTAVASFVSGVLTVVSATSTPADIQAGSIIMGNPGTTNPFYATISAPASIPANYNIVLPAKQSAQNFLAMDTAGNITGFAPVAAGITGAMIAPTTVANSNIVNTTITAAKIANATITGTQVASNINLPGKVVQENGNNVVVSNTNPSTNSLAIVRAVFVFSGGSFTVPSGEGITSIVINSTGNYTITWTTAFIDTPTIYITPINNNPPVTTITATLTTTPATSACTVQFTGSNTSLTSAANSSFNFLAIGQRA